MDNAGKFIAVGNGVVPSNVTLKPGNPPRKVGVFGLSDEDCDEECKKFEACEEEGHVPEDYICGKGKDGVWKASCGGDSGGE